MNVGVLEFRDLISRLEGVGGEASAVRNIANRCSDAEGPACGSRAGDAPIDGLNPPLVDGAVVERVPGWDGEARPGEPELSQDRYRVIPSGFEIDRMYPLASTTGDQDSVGVPSPLSNNCVRL